MVKKLVFISFVSIFSVAKIKNTEVKITCLLLVWHGLKDVFTTINTTIL